MSTYTWRSGAVPGQHDPLCPLTYCDEGIVLTPDGEGECQHCEGHGCDCWCKPIMLGRNGERMLISSEIREYFAGNPWVAVGGRHARSMR